MNKKTLIESFAELQEAKDKLLKELLNNFNYYKKYKNLKNKNKRYRRIIRKLKKKLGDIWVNIILKK